MRIARRMFRSAIVGAVCIAVLCSAGEGQESTRESKRTGPPTPEEGRLALATAWRSLDEYRWTLNSGRRKLGITELLTEKEMDTIFPPGQDIEVGPVQVWKLRLYGPDITYPLDHVLMQTAGVLAQSLLNNYVGFQSRVGRAALTRGAATRLRTADADAQVTEVPTGSTEMSCGSDNTFHEEQFRAADLWMEMSVTRDTYSAISEIHGADWRWVFSKWMTLGMKELGYNQTTWLQVGDRVYLEKALPIFRVNAFSPATSFRSTIQMHGPCLFPMYVEKQTALQAVLEDLLARSGHVFIIRLEQVDQTEPIFTARGMYSFVNVTLVGAKYDGPGILTVEEMMSGEGGSDFAPQESGESRFQERMKAVGLVVRNAFPTNTEVLNGDPPVSPEDTLQALAAEKVARKWKELLTRGRNVGYAVLGTVAAILTGLGIWNWLQKYSRLAHRDSQQRYHQSGSFQDRASLSGTYGIQASPLLSRASKEVHRSGSMGSSVHEPLWDDTIPATDIQVAQRPDGSPIVLGKGSFGEVLMGLRDGVHEVALKVFQSRTEVSHDTFLREVQLLKSCRNSNIVQFQGLVYSGHEIWLVMEYMPGGNLYSAIQKKKPWIWNLSAALIARDVARGMAFLHSRGVIHLDLKSPNILLTADGQAKIADVGLAHLLSESCTHASNLGMGTFAWMAPEVLLHGRASFSADIFAFGVILWELVTGEVPQRGRLRSVQVPDECPEEVAKLMQTCLSPEALQRPSAKEITLELQILLDRMLQQMSADSRTGSLKEGLLRQSAGVVPPVQDGPTSSSTARRSTDGAGPQPATLNKSILLGSIRSVKNLFAMLVSPFECLAFTGFQLESAANLTRGSAESLGAVRLATPFHGLPEREDKAAEPMWEGSRGPHVGETLPGGPSGETQTMQDMRPASLAMGTPDPASSLDSETLQGRFQEACRTLGPARGHGGLETLHDQEPLPLRTLEDTASRVHVPGGPWLEETLEDTASRAYIPGGPRQEETLEDTASRVHVPAGSRQEETMEDPASSVHVPGGLRLAETLEDTARWVRLLSVGPTVEQNLGDARGAMVPPLEGGEKPRDGAESASTAAEPLERPPPSSWQTLAAARGTDWETRGSPPDTLQGGDHRNPQTGGAPPKLFQDVSHDASETMAVWSENLRDAGMGPDLPSKPLHGVDGEASQSLMGSASLAGPGTGDVGGTAFASLQGSASLTGPGTGERPSEPPRRTNGRKPESVTQDSCRPATADVASDRQQGADEAVIAPKSEGAEHVSDSPTATSRYQHSADLASNPQQRANEGSNAPETPESIAGKPQSRDMDTAMQTLWGPHGKRLDTLGGDLSGLRTPDIGQRRPGEADREAGAGEVDSGPNTAELAPLTPQDSAEGSRA